MSKHYVEFVWTNCMMVKSIFSYCFVSGMETIGEKLLDVVELIELVILIGIKYIDKNTIMYHLKCMEANKFRCVRDLTNS